MKKSEIKLENNSSLKVNKLGLFKSIVNILKEVGSTSYINATAETIITPPPNNLKNQQAYLTLGC